MIYECPDLPEQTKSHFEYRVDRNYAAEKRLKNDVYRKLKDVEGWCPTSKVSFIMDLIFTHKPKVIVEIGVWGGKSLIPMAESLKYLHFGKVYGIDPWKSDSSVVGQIDVNADWWGMVDHVGVMNHFLDKLDEFQLNNYVKVIRATSESAQPISNIDILHIDGNHSEESALFDVQKWVPLVRDGGFIIFDDLDWTSTKKAVEWLDQNCRRITTFHETNVWGVWIKNTSG